MWPGFIKRPQQIMKQWFSKYIATQVFIPVRWHFFSLGFLCSRHPIMYAKILKKYIKSKIM